MESMSCGRYEEEKRNKKISTFTTTQSYGKAECQCHVSVFSFWSIANPNALFLNIVNFDIKEEIIKNNIYQNIDTEFYH